MQSIGGGESEVGGDEVLVVAAEVRCGIWGRSPKMPMKVSFLATLK